MICTQVIMSYENKLFILNNQLINNPNGYTNRSNKTIPYPLRKEHGIKTKTQI